MYTLWRLPSYTFIVFHSEISVTELVFIEFVIMFQRVGGFDVRNQMDTMAAKMTGKIRNVTCVMQELGYVSALG